MKRSYISFIILVLAMSVFAQSPLSFKYQAYLRNADGTIRGNEFVTLELEIVQGSVSGATIYSEVHNTSTNSHGLVSVTVGEGSTSSNMNAVQWGSGPFFLEITVNGIFLGTTELLSVPYALYANETGSSFSGEYSDLTGAPNLATVATTGNYVHLTNRPNLALVATTGSYASLLNVPATFTPAVHAHLETDISNLAHYTDDSINGLEPVFTHWDKDTADDFSGSYLDLTDAPVISAHYTDDSISGNEAAFNGWDKDTLDDFVGDMGGLAITNLADPVNPQDAATMAYVDASSGSFSGSFTDLTDVPVTLDRDSTNNLPVSFNDLTDVPVTLDRDSTNNLPVSFNALTDVPANLDIDATDDFTGDMAGGVITNLTMPALPGAATDGVNRAYVAALEATVTALTIRVAALEAALIALTARVDAAHPPPP